MNEVTEKMTAESTIPPDVADAGLEVGDVLRDRQHRQYFVITTVDEHGVGLRDAETDFYVPYSLFASKHGSRLHPIDEADSIDPPDWTEE